MLRNDKKYGMNGMKHNNYYFVNKTIRNDTSETDTSARPDYDNHNINNTPIKDFVKMTTATVMGPAESIV